MQNNNFIISNVDTDAISFCKQDMSFISKEERQQLLENLNSIYDAEIKFTDDGYFPKFIVLKAKNYIMYDGKKIKLKGSALKSSTLEPKFKALLKEFIDAIVFIDDRDELMHKLLNIYEVYVKEIALIKDITPWAKKMTLSEKTYESERENEQKVIRAISGKEFKEGDKVYVFFKENKELCLVQDFTGDYDKDVYYEKLYKTAKRFETILDVSQFKNYKLKKNKSLLEQLK